MPHEVRDALARDEAWGEPRAEFPPGGPAGLAGSLLRASGEDSGAHEDASDEHEEAGAARPRRYRALFVSDLHLGTRGCQSRLFLDFLRAVDADTIYLVGDIVDAWRLKQVWYWPQAHNDVVQKLLRKVRKRVRLIYLPGNHDEFLKDYPGLHFGGVEVATSAIHHGADGRRYLVVHGDAFDVVVRHARWLALFGDRAYDAALVVNTYLNIARRRLGLSYWSLSQWAKLRVKGAVNFIGGFEAALVAEARRQRVDGIICGHIHHAAIHDRLGLRYMNCGDWVESCTALAETYEGDFELLRWPPGVGAEAPDDAPARARAPSDPAQTAPDLVADAVHRHAAVTEA